MLAKLRYALNVCAARSAGGDIGMLRQLAEIAALWLSRDIGYDLYHYARLSRRSLTLRYKAAFIGRPAYRRLVAALNPVEHRRNVHCKPLEKAFFQHLDLPNPEYLGTWHAGTGTTPDGHPLRSLFELEAWLCTLAPAQICFKPVEGASGEGFLAYELHPARDSVMLRRLDGPQIMSVAEVARHHDAVSADGWLLERYVEQHPALARFNPSSVNTVRLTMLQGRDDKARCLGAFLKTGRPGALIDKTEHGGAAVLVNITSGALEQGFDWSPAMTPLSAHPASGEAFVGAVIPHWREALGIAARALEDCPGLRFAGVDIAIAAAGPLIIEMNPFPDIDTLHVLGITGDDLAAGLPAGGERVPAGSFA